MESILPLVTRKPNRGRPRAQTDLGSFQSGWERIPHLVSCRLQDPADDGVSKGRVIHIGVANDIDKVTLLPSPGRHIRPGRPAKIQA